MIAGGKSVFISTSNTGFASTATSQEYIKLFHLSLQLWDLTSGKLLHDFKQHTAAANCVEFHPKEFLLATASNDRFVFHSFLCNN